MEEFLDFEELDLEYLPEETPYDELKRGYFNESRYAKNFKRSTNKNKILRNVPRSDTHFLSIKKAEVKLELRVEQKEREKDNFWKKYNRVGIIAARPSPQASSTNPTPYVPFAAANSQYERELQQALKASAQTDKHASGISFQALLDLSSRELTPEDYEMLLLLDTLVEKKTTSSDVLQSLNETVADESTVGDCPICVCSFEAGDKLKHLTCSHVFHVDCVTEWLTNHSRTCPLCNATVT